MDSYRPASSQSGPSRVKPPPPSASTKERIVVDLTGSSDEDDEDCQILPPKPRPAGMLKPTTKSNLPPVKPGPFASSSTGLPKPTSTYRPVGTGFMHASKISKGTQFDAISITSSESGGSIRRGPSSNSAASGSVPSPNRTPRAGGAVKKSGGGFGAHRPRDKSATPALGLGERGRIGRTVSRDKVELGSAHGSRSGSVSGSKSGRSSSTKREKGVAKIEKRSDCSESSQLRSKQIKPERNYAIFASSSQTTKVKPEPKSPSKTLSQTSRFSHSRNSSSSRIKPDSTPKASTAALQMDEMDAFFSPINSTRPGKSVISQESALRAGAREKSLSTTSIDRTPTKVRVAHTQHSGEKRKRYGLADEEEPYVPPVRTRHGSISAMEIQPAVKGRVRVRSERTANQPPVNYVVPTMDAPLEVWTRPGRGGTTPKRVSGSSSALSSAPALSRGPSSSSSGTIPTVAEDDSAEPLPKRHKLVKTPNRTPAANSNASDSSALTSISSIPSPSRRRRMSSAQNTPIGRKLSLLAQTPRSGAHATPSKTPKAIIAAVVPVVEAEPVNLLDMFADFEFAPSPEAPKAATPGAPSPTAHRSPLPNARRLSYSVASPIKAKVELSPATIRRNLEEELDAKIERENALKEAAEAQAKAKSEAMWDHLNNLQNDEEEEEEEVLESIAAMAQRAVEQPSPPKRTSRSKGSVSPSGPPRAKRTKQDRANDRFFDNMEKEHEFDVSFESAVAYSRSRSDSRSPHSSPPERADRTFAYPTPTSRDPSIEPVREGRARTREQELERMIPEVVIELNQRSASKSRVLTDIAKVSLQDLDEDMRGPAAEMVREAKAAEAADKVELGWAGVWVRPAAVASVGEIGVEGLCMAGMWGRGVKSAQKGDFGILALLIPSSALQQLDESQTRALASFCLQNWLQNGIETAMTCLFHLVDLATHHPFTSSTTVKDIICTVLSSLGMDEVHLPTDTPAIDQSPAMVRRDGTIAALAVLLTKQNMLLSGSDALDLASVLCLIYADRSTSPTTKGLIQSALKELWSVCLEDINAIQLATKICDIAEPLPSCAQREVLYSIGMSSTSAREISQWVAAGLLRCDALTDTTRQTPSIKSLERGIYAILDELDESSPNHNLIDRQLTCLYNMVRDVYGIMYAAPLPKSGEVHELDTVLKLLSRADSKIRRSITATTVEIGNKMRLGQLAAVIGAKLDSALKKRRAEEQRKKDAEMKGLVRGVGEQARLSFGVKKEVGVKEE